MSFLNHLRKVFSNNRGETGAPATESAAPASPAGDAGGAGDGGDSAPSWIDVLPDDAKQDPNVTKFKTPDDFYKSYKQQLELVGRKGVIVPTKESSPEEVEKFYNSLGRPEKPDGYKLNPIEGLHKSIQVTPETTAAFNMMAHKHGLTNSQADGLNQFMLKALNQAVVDQEKRETEVMQKAETTLRQEWGEKYDANLSMIKKVILKTGGPEAIEAMGGENGIGNNPVVLRTLGKIFSAMGEDQLNVMGAASSAGSQGSETKDQALAKIQEMTNDPKHPLNDASHRDHEDAVKERMRLYQIAYGGGDA